MRTDDDIQTTANAVRFSIKMQLRQAPRDLIERRWSRVTLYLTQEWEIDDRYRVWVMAMHQDLDAELDAIIRDNPIDQLRRQVEMYGNDGSVKQVL